MTIGFSRHNKKTSWIRSQLPGSLRELCHRHGDFLTGWPPVQNKCSHLEAAPGKL
jgi:hypothetical protein